jgi:hypothetical protein
MSIIIDQYQDSGPLLSGRGTTTTLINNVGWKVDGGAEGLDYAEYPILRPSITPQTRSFQYYTFFKLSGTYIKASRIRIAILGIPLSGVKLFCGLADTYATPTSDHIGDLTYYQPPTVAGSIGLVMYPKLSLTSPITGLSYPQYLTGNTTYYTQYLKTQLYVEAGSYGNVDDIKIKCYVDEYEEDDL